jgi:hypothetical protein
MDDDDSPGMKFMESNAIQRSIQSHVHTVREQWWDAESPCHQMQWSQGLPAPKTP